MGEGPEGLGLRPHHTHTLDTLVPLGAVADAPHPALQHSGLPEQR
jgi:hypothetical protein